MASIEENTLLLTGPVLNALSSKITASWKRLGPSNEYPLVDGLITIELALQP